MRRQFLIALVVLIVGGTMGNLMRYTERRPDRPAELASIPLVVESYRGREKEFNEVTLEVLNATSSRMVSYSGRSGPSCNLFVAYFISQRFGSGIHSPKHCLPGGGWRIETNEPFVIDVDGGPPITANRLRIAYGNTKNVMLYWYQTRAGAVRDEFGLKYSLFKSSLLMRPTDAAMVRVTVPVEDGDYGQATQRALDFLAVMEPHLREALPF